MGFALLTAAALFYLLAPAVSIATFPTKATSVTSRTISSGSTTYDYIIVGGGLTGLTVADRLTEDASVNVLVIEAGPLLVPEPSSISVPGLYNPFPVIFQPLESVPQSQLENKSFLAAAAKVFGGGSVANGLLWFRSSAPEYGAWQELGASNVTWEELLPYFKKNENFTAPESAFAKQANISYDESVHGTNGPIHVAYPDFYYPSSGNWWEAALATNLTATPDLNGGNPNGISTITLSVDATNYTRSDARIGYYTQSSAYARPNYHIMVNHTVSRVVVRNGITIGVEYVPTAGGATTSVNVTREVLIAAGGVHTPQLLQLSGIGPKALLTGLGIPVVEDLPGVGTNLQDMPNFAIPYNITNNRFPSQTTFANNASYDNAQLALYSSSHSGPYVLPLNEGSNIAILPLSSITNNYSAIVREAQKRSPAASLPKNTDSTVLAGYTAQREIRLQQLNSSDVPAVLIAWSTGTSATLFLSQSLSRGSITINTTNVLNQPVIDWRALTDPTDYEIMVSAVLRNRDIMQAPGMSSLDAREVSPFGDSITDFNTLRSALASVGQPSLAHMCCTAPQMSKSNGGVVDATYKVYGISGLRVIDIAALPLLVTLPPQAALYALAERIADIIKDEQSST